VDGDYTQGVGGTLTMEIGGAVPGTEHDVLDVTGDVVLDGELVLLLIDGFAPADQTDYEVISAGGGLSGDFATVTPPADFGAIGTPHSPVPGVYQATLTAAGFVPPEPPAPDQTPEINEESPDTTEEVVALDESVDNTLLGGDVAGDEGGEQPGEAEEAEQWALTGEDEEEEEDQSGGGDEGDEGEGTGDDTGQDNVSRVRECS